MQEVWALGRYPMESTNRGRPERQLAERLRRALNGSKLSPEHVGELQELRQARRIETSEKKMHPHVVKLQEVNSVQTVGVDSKYREQLLRAYRFLQEAVGCVMYMDQLMNRPGSEPLRDLLVHPLAVQLQEVKSAQKALEIVTKLCLEEGV